MERVMLKDMTTLEDEAKIEREQGKLAQEKIACLTLSSTGSARFLFHGGGFKVPAAW